MEHNPNYKAQFAEVDGTYYCTICGKKVDLKKGDEVPLCCGKVMLPMD
jgi:DNA-directed RNA polymerase subunit RPC12/RpoP